MIHKYDSCMACFHSNQWLLALQMVNTSQHVRLNSTRTQVKRVDIWFEPSQLHYVRYLVKLSL